MAEGPNDVHRDMHTRIMPPPLKVQLNPWQYKLWCDLGFPPESAMIDPPLPEEMQP